MRQTPLPYGKQWIDDADIAAVTDTLKSDFLTCGPKIAELEEKLKKITGASYACTVNSATSALHAACFAAGIGEGDEVIVTPFTFMASANCILYVGAKPVFADIDPETYNISPDSVREKISGRTKAVIAVDYAGEAADADSIRMICDEYKLVFIEDAAHAIGSRYKGRPCGSYADITCMSFHPVKTVTAGEGGALLTNNKTYAERAALFRSHGMEHDHEFIKYTGDKDDFGSWYYDQVFLGYNYRMTDISAALLISQLDKLDKFSKLRKRLVKSYDEAFSEIPEIITQKSPEYSDATRHLYTIRLDLDRLSCTRKEFFEAMREENIYCQIHYIPVYYFSNYRKMGYEKGSCPTAEKVYSSIMSIPLFPKMTDEDQNDVIAAVKKLIERYKK